VRGPAEAYFGKRMYQEARADVNEALRLNSNDQKAKNLDAELKRKGLLKEEQTMNEFIKIFLTIKDFVTRISKVIQFVKDLLPGLKTESEKETYTFESEENGVSTKLKVTHKKSNTSFHIGMLLKNDKDEPELFISINNIDMILKCTYLAATPLCSGGEECNGNGEVRYFANKEINEEYFSETTTEDRKDEIIEQILTEVSEAINNQCSSGE
jgi:hypothetical protein